ncbi:MAG: hypothetical protein PHN77_20680, partial [Thermoguttaceae bacterium]|nr:hypothetical protein [Thermoguttaceae bacterium]
LVANTLADLTKPECRFAHHPDPRIWTPARWTNSAPGIVRFQHERRPHPFFYRPWLGEFVSGVNCWVPGLGLPILAECSAGNWQAGGPLPINTPPSPVNPALAADVLGAAPFDAWANPHPWDPDIVDALTGAMTNYAGARIGEDVVLTNVIGFDVKAWDPYAPILDSPAGVPLLPGDPGYITRIGAGVGPANVLGTGAYVDLNYLALLGGPAGAVLPNLGGLPGYTPFCGAGALPSRVYGTLPQYAESQTSNEFYPAVYDTWSLHYEFNRRQMRFTPGGPLEEVGDEDRDGIFDEGSDGIDNNGKDGVDDIAERETQPPYAVPLQGIQVRIRTFEPGSRQIREVTLVQKFRTK